MKKSEAYYFKSCDTLPIYNFYKILNTKELKWLIKDYDEDDEIEDEKLITLWEDIYEEYIDLLGEKAVTKKSVAINQLQKMELEIRIVSSLIKMYIDRKFDEIGEQIDEWGYDKNDLEKSIKKLESLKFRMDILKSKTDVKEDEEVKYDLYNDIVSIETILGNGINIDPHKTVVSKWVSYILISEKKNAKRSD